MSRFYHCQTYKNSLTAKMGLNPTRDSFQLYLQFRSRVEENKEQNRENNIWRNAMKITLLGLILLCATQCPTEVTPEVMSYLVIGIQTAMGNRAQKKKTLTRKGKETEPKRKSSGTGTSQIEVQVPNEEDRRTQPETPEKTKEKKWMADSRLY